MPAAWFRRLGLVLVSALLLPLAVCAPAQAHPLGDPQQATLTLADQNTVLVHWSAPSDDFAWLALELGLLPQGRILLDGAVLFEDGDNELLAEAPEFETYLLANITVSQPSGTCQGTVSDRTKVGDQGVTMSFACAEPVTTVDVGFSTLLDLDSRYTTQVTAPDGEEFLYSSTSTTHQWDLSGATTDSAGDADSGAVAPQTILGWTVLGVLTVLLVAGIGVIWWRGRRTAPEAEAKSTEKTAKRRTKK